MVFNNVEIISGGFEARKKTSIKNYFHHLIRNKGILQNQLNDYRAMAASIFLNGSILECLWQCETKCSNPYEENISNDA